MGANLDSKIELNALNSLSQKEIDLGTDYDDEFLNLYENVIKEADIDDREAIVFLRSCDMHAVKRLDQIYLYNGKHVDAFYIVLVA